MAKLLVILKVLPTDIDVDLKKEIVDEVSKKLPEGYELMRYDIVPIAFGLNALRLYILMPEDEEGGTEKLEEIIKSIEKVSEVEVEMLHRMSF